MYGQLTGKCKMKLLSEFKFVVIFFLLEGCLVRAMMPTLVLDYKIHVDAGKEDCYFQDVEPQATFYVGYQVLKGGDNQIGMGVRNPSGAIVHPYAWKRQSEYQEMSPTGGTFSVCLDNKFSTFYAKLVNVYISVIRYDAWDDISRKTDEIESITSNAAASLQNIEYQLSLIEKYQRSTRSQVSRDISLQEDNASYVVFLSTFHMLLLVIATALQIYFVKSLFATRR